MNLNNSIGPTSSTDHTMPSAQRSEMLRLLRASAQRATLALLLGAILSVVVDVTSDLAARAPTTHWLMIGLFALQVTGAIVSFTKWRGAEKHRVVRELLDHRGSAIRVTSSDRGVRIILASGEELRFSAGTKDLARALEILREHSPDADFASHDR